MDLPFELFIAVRYLMARRKQAFISLISLISAVGVAVGVMALLIVLALMTGLQGELRDRIVGSAAHVYVFKAGGFGDAGEEVKKVLRRCRASSARRPVVLGQGLAKSAGANEFITIKGIDPVARAERDQRRAIDDCRQPERADAGRGLHGRHRPWQGPGAEARRQPRRQRRGADA